MSITKRTFLMVSSLVSVILLTLNCATYLLFQDSISRQLIASQQAMIEANVRLSGIFTQTVDQLVYQYTSDPQLGQLLSTNVGQDELQDLNTKSLLNSCISYQLNAVSLLLNNGFHVELFINPELDVSRLFSPSNTIPNVSLVFSGETVKQESWYQAAIQRHSGQYIFLSQDQSRLCFACKLQNSAFTGPHQKDGIGVLRGSLPVSQLPHLLSLVPVTDNSGFVLLNPQGDQVFRSSNLEHMSLSDSLLMSDSTRTQVRIGQEQYLCTWRELQWGLELVFLTPYDDITHQVWGMMFPYLLCSVFFLVLGVLLSLALSTSLSRPVVQLTQRIEAIQDIRNVEWDTSSLQTVREIQQLSDSFGSLIRCINDLIQELTRKEALRRESELRALQAQINPHFMLNAMNVVNYMALEREADDIASIVDSIASLMRYSITEPDRMVMIQTELDNIQEYITIHILRFRQDIHLEILPGLSPSQVAIPKFTLQPLVENSIRHGITRQDPGITIRIHIQEQPEHILIDVTDTGSGADAALLNAYLAYQDVSLSVSHGFGIRNVNQRLQLRFGDQSGLCYFNTPNGELLARITIPKEPPPLNHLS